MDLEHARMVAIEAAEAAGELLLQGTRETLDIRAKGSTGDVVTALDLASERLLLDRILTAFPTHSVLAEESGLVGAPGGEWTWLIDPLDGTNNVAIGMPLYAIGLALCHRGRPVLGVVHDPVMSRTWSAIRSRGAHGPAGVRLAPAPRSTPYGPVVAWIQGYAVTKDDSLALDIKSRLDHQARRVLRLWAPLLGWAMLARGDIDGVVGYQTGVIDLPAGAILAQEAGLEIRALDGGPYDEDIDGPDESRSFVCAHPATIDSLFALLGPSAPEA